MARKPSKCMKLIHEKVTGERIGRVDVCRLDAGHEGDHRGQYAGMTWGTNRHGDQTVHHHGDKITFGSEPDSGIGQRAAEPEVA